MKINGRTAALFVAAVVLLQPIIASASPEFLPYEGRNSVHEGQGGEKKIVEGIEFWSNGDPPHRFKVLGAISDRRMKTGIYGLIRMSGLEEDIAKSAKAAGGDAVILQNAGDDVIGVSGFSNGFINGNGSGGSFSASGFGSSFAAPVKAHVSRYIVVRYLPDEAPSAPPPGAATLGAPTAPVAPPQTPEPPSPAPAPR